MEVRKLKYTPLKLAEKVPVKIKLEEGVAYITDCPEIPSPANLTELERMYKETKKEFDELKRQPNTSPKLKIDYRKLLLDMMGKKAMVLKMVVNYLKSIRTEMLVNVAEELKDEELTPPERKLVVKVLNLVSDEFDRKIAEILEDINV